MLRYGNMPSSTNNLQDSPPARYIPPGETVDLKMSGDEYERVQSLLQREGVRRSVRSAKFLVRAVFFDGDGEEMWGHGGYLMKRDEKDPKTYHPVGLYVLPNKPE